MCGFCPWSLTSKYTEKYPLCWGSEKVQDYAKHTELPR